jgi:NAD+-dependent protein deacetylase sirtuin 4
VSPRTTLEDLAHLFHGRRIVALTGAGCSTESGIPDYRGEGTRARARNPIQGPTFAKSEPTRRRYWARAAVGWEKFSAAQPNDAHHALAALEANRHLLGVITQNVDRLHQRAGSREVIELHGALEEVRCLACGAFEARRDVQRRIKEQNPFHLSKVGELNPDGDADLEADETFIPPRCLLCEGPLKPNVVFFGDSVPRPTVDRAFAMLDAADALLVAGTSLAVYSGYRFLRHARDRGIPIGLVNVGESRGSDVVDVWVEARVGSVLPRLVQRLESDADSA